MESMQARVLLAGRARGPVLKLETDISFWGGVDPRTGCIIDQRHPQYGKAIAGTILAMYRSIGSSSGSSVLLELFRRERAPLGIILVESDFVISLGAVVAREMVYADIPVVCVDPAGFSALPHEVEIYPSGLISVNSTRV